MTNSLPQSDRWARTLTKPFLRDEAKAGRTPKETAAEVGCSENTVRDHHVLHGLLDVSGAPKSLADDYERLGDTAVNALADKFDVVQDDRLEIGRTHPFGARVSITTEDAVHERLYADPSGEPDSFPDALAMQQKFLTLARPVLNGRADALADAILSLERFDRVEMATRLGRQ